MDYMIEELRAAIANTEESSKKLAHLLRYDVIDEKDKLALSTSLEVNERIIKNLKHKLFVLLSL